MPSVSADGAFAFGAMRVSNPMSDEKLSDMGHPDFDEGELLLRRGFDGTVAAAGPHSAGSALTA